MEHAFAAECSSGIYPIQTAHQLSRRTPGFNTVGIARPMERAVGAYQGRRNPGSRLTGAGRVSASRDHFGERAIQRKAQFGLPLRLAQACGNMQVGKV